jgi:hypothetical protein
MPKVRLMIQGTFVLDLINTSLRFSSRLVGNSIFVLLYKWYLPSNTLLLLSLLSPMGEFSSMTQPLSLSSYQIPVRLFPQIFVLLILIWVQMDYVLKLWPMKIPRQTSLSYSPSSGTVPPLRESYDLGLKASSTMTYIQPPTWHGAFVNYDRDVLEWK